MRRGKKVLDERGRVIEGEKKRGGRETEGKSEILNELQMSEGKKRRYTTAALIQLFTDESS